MPNTKVSNKFNRCILLDMDEGNQEEVIQWEYKWGSSDINEMNRLGKVGWEAVGTSTSTRALAFGATLPSNTSVLYKRRLGLKLPPKPTRENEEGLRLKQLLDEERSKKKTS